MPSCWVIVPADDVLKYCSYFFRKIGFDITLGDYLHETSNHIFYTPIIDLSSAEFDRGMLNVKHL